MIPSMKMNVHVEYTKRSKSQDSFLKHVKENDQKKEGSQRERVQLKHQPAPAPSFFFFEVLLSFICEVKSKR